MSSWCSSELEFEMGNRRGISSSFMEEKLIEERGLDGTRDTLGVAGEEILRVKLKSMR